MKKNILKATLVVGFALVAGYNVYNLQKSDVMSDLALANVEALASGELEVTCESDPGDTCMVGSTPVKNWDEKSGWF